MKTSEFVVAALFVGGVISVFFTGLALAVWTWRRRGKERPSGRIRVVRTVVWLAGLVGALCVGWAFIEPHRLVVEHQVLASAKIPPGLTIRIVQISDLHSEGHPGLERKLPDIIRRASPQVIVFTGDAANTAQGMEVFRSCMREVSAIAPTYGVRGNWDGRFRPENVLEGTGGTELCGDSVTMDLGGAKLWIGGAPRWEKWWAGQLGASAPPDAFKLFLYHSPDGIEDAAEAGMDLCLVGHTHGGQVRLPFYGALVTLTRVGKKYESGLYRVGEMWAYVNRGIGMEGHGAPRIRFICPPEVTVIDLVSAETAAR